MGKQIMIKEELYKRLKGLQAERGKKTFTELLTALAQETSAKDLLLHELTEAYNELKVKVVGHIRDGIFVGIIERARIITIQLAKCPPKDRPPLVLLVEKGLDDLIKITAPGAKETPPAKTNPHSIPVEQLKSYPIIVDWAKDKVFADYFRDSTTNKPIDSDANRKTIIAALSCYFDKPDLRQKGETDWRKRLDLLWAGQAAKFNAMIDLGWEIYRDRYP